VTPDVILRKSNASCPVTAGADDPSGVARDDDVLEQVVDRLRQKP
jgi:hypothetical protein